MNFNPCSSGISAESIEQQSSFDILNSALDDLGLLSRVTDSRQQYLQEKKQILSRLEALSLTDSSVAAMPCPPCLPTVDQSSSAAGCGSSLTTCAESSSNERHSSFFPRIPCTFLLNSSSSSDANEANNSSSIEKENTLFSGFKTLTVNSNFLSTFKSDYSLPDHLSGSAKTRHSFPSGVHDQGKVLQKDNIRNFIRRRRLRTHPYENSERYSALFEMCVNDSVKGNTMTGCYRLRTASLSSGVSGKVKQRPPSRGVAVPDHVAVGSSPGLGVRSRSMEDLSAADLSCTAELHAAVLRTREVENVSRAIQQMCVQDSG
ncbi:hypothetical protein FHG87_018382 [Trinorchestia longiramus]|nr:hypothetical protein FHG87_018382 [Trinorchestia longiramus]